MSISRFDTKFPRYDWSWQTYIPQFEELNAGLLDETMGNIQNGFNQSNLLTEKNPNVLNTKGDKELFNQYQLDVQSGLDNVAQAYQRSIREGQAAQNNFLQQVRQDWLPGGRAYALNSRYQGYAQAVDDIEKFSKDDTRGINSGLARYSLQSMLQSGPQYDAKTRSYKSVQTPDLIKDPDIRKAANEMIKQIEEDGDTQFLQGIDGDKRQGWITKIKTEGRSQQKLGLAMQALLDMPEYANQVGRDALYQGFSSDPLQLRSEYQKQLTSEFKDKESAFKAASESKDPALVRQVQRFLSKTGYDVTEDGQYGEQTKSAIEQYRKDTQSKIKSAIDNFDPQSYLENKVRSNYIDYAEGFANQKTTKDLVFDKVWQTRQKIAADKANTDKLVSAIDRLAPVKSDDVTVVDAPAISFGDFKDNLNKTRQTQVEAYKTAEQVKTQDPLFKGWKNEDVVSAYRVYEDLVKKNPQASLNEIRQMYGNTLRQWSQESGKPYTLTPEVESALFDRVQQGREAGTIQAIDQLWSVDEQVNRNVGLMQNFGKTYAETEEGKRNIEEQLGKYRKQGETDEQLVQRAFANPEQFNVSTSRFNRLDPTDLPHGSRSDSYNSAEIFLNKMQSDIARQQKQGSVNYLDKMGTTTLLFSDKDEYVGPTLKRIQEDVNASPFGIYNSEGSQSLVFRSPEGREVVDVNAQNFKVTNTEISTDTDGKTVLVFKGQVKKGQNTESVYTTVRPTVYQLAELRQGLSGELAQAYERGDLQKQIEIGKKIEGLEDPKWSNYASFDSARQNLNRQNTTEQKVFYRRNGRLEELPATWRYTKDKLQQDVGDGTNRYYYNIQHAYDPQSGAKYTLNIQEQKDASGNSIFVAEPTANGQFDYGSSVNAYIVNKNKEIIARTPVERSTSKIENPQVLNTLLGQ